MPKKRLVAEQTVTKLRRVEVLQSQGKSIATACKKMGLTEQSYYRYRKEYGGPNVEQAPKLKQLELENGRLALSGKISEGIDCLSEAIRIDPFGAVDCLVGKGIAEYTARRYEAAVETFGKVSGLALLRHACIAACYAQLGRKGKARTAFVVAVDLARSNLAAKVGAEVEGLRTYLGAVFHFQNLDSFEHLINGLRKAGSED